MSESHPSKRTFAAILRRVVKWGLRTRKERKRIRLSRAAFARNGLLRNTPDPRYPERVREFWRQHYGKAVDPLWHVACANVTGKEDVRYVPNGIWFDEILPFFNKMSMRPAYIDKNLSEQLLPGVNIPATIVRRMHGEYYGSDYVRLSREAALAKILSGGAVQIVKPSLTDNGIGIRKLEIAAGAIMLGGQAVGLDTLERSHGADFIVQARIRQHATLAEPHPASVNTIRLVTFRWHGEIRPLLAFARFGTGGNLTDNAGTGGVCCGIDDDGRLNATAVDEHGMVYAHHPTTGYDFGKREVVPNYADLCRQALELHRNLRHFDLVSWDFAVGEHSEPVFVEFNVRGASYVYQFACGKPLFGELTTEVLELMRDRGRVRAVEYE